MTWFHKLPYYRSVVALTCLLVVSGCTGARNTDVEQPDTQIAAVEPQQEVEVVAPLAAEPETVLEVVPESAPEPEPIIIVPAQSSLMGATTQTLIDMFGTPSFVREDPPAQLWQYKTSGCILDVYFYENSQQSYRLNHIEVRTTNFEFDGFENCARLILKNQKI